MITPFSWPGGTGLQLTVIEEELAASAVIFAGGWPGTGENIKRNREVYYHVKI